MERRKRKGKRTERSGESTVEETGMDRAEKSGEKLTEECLI